MGTHRLEFWLRPKNTKLVRNKKQKMPPRTERPASYPLAGIPKITQLSAYRKTACDIFFDRAAVEVCAAADGFVTTAGFVKDFAIAGEECFCIKRLRLDAGRELLEQVGGLWRCARGIITGNQNPANGLFQFTDVARPGIARIDRPAQGGLDMGHEFGSWFPKHARERVFDELPEFLWVLLKPLP